MGRFIPPDHAAGDERTLGGYLAVHARPPAFEAEDGYSYSVAVGTDTTGDREVPWGGFLLFLRWRRLGAQGVEGHLETGFLATGRTEAEATAGVHALPLAEVQERLAVLVHAEMEQARADRMWWDVMRDEGDDDDR